MPPSGSLARKGRVDEIGRDIGYRIAMFGRKLTLAGRCPISVTANEVVVGLRWGAAARLHSVVEVRGLPLFAFLTPKLVARGFALADFGTLAAQTVARVTSSPRHPVVGQISDT